MITRYKAQIIAAGCDPLDPDEARAAEARVLGRAGGLTPAGLRHAIAQAVIEVNAEKAKKRREAARKHARVEVFGEYSGNAALEAHELPMAEAAAMDQRISWWADQLKASGAEGSRDQLRARALVDLVLGRDSRPGHAGESLAAVPAGFAGCLNLTIPAATILGLADRPGEITTMGPIDPWLARDLATAAAQNPKTTWCVTVTDKDGHAVAHGCARPDPRQTRKHPAGPTRPPAPDSPSPPMPAPDQPTATTAPGDSAPPAQARTSSSPSNPSPPTPATTNTKPPPTTPASSSAI